MRNDSILILPSIPTISLTLATLLPDMMATKTSRRLASLSKTFFVSVGITARSGCLQIGVSVPKMSKNNNLSKKFANCKLSLNIYFYVLTTVNYLPS